MIATAEQLAPKPRTLHAITDDLLAVEQLLADLEGDVSDDIGQIVDKWLAELNDDLEGKADNYAALIIEIEKRAQARKAEADRMALLAKRDGAHADWLKTKLKATLELFNIKKVETPRFRLTVCANGGKIPLIIDEPNVPKDYKAQKVEWVIDTDSIRNDLEQGNTLGFAKLGERGSHLRIK